MLTNVIFMLRSVQINRFRSCVGVSFNVEEALLVLVGRNGAGKTNAMRAIEWVAKSAIAVPNQPLELNSASVTLRFEIVGRRFAYSVALDGAADRYKAEEDQHVRSESLIEEFKDGRAEAIFRLENGFLHVVGVGNRIKIGIDATAIASINSLIPDFEEAALLANVVEFFNSIKYYPLYEPESVDTDASAMFISAEAVESWVAGKSNGKLTPNRLLALKLVHLFVHEQDKFNELQSIAGVSGLNVINKISVVSFEVPFNNEASGQSNNTTRYYHLSFTPSKFSPEKNAFNFEQLSFGTKRIVRLLTCLIYDKTSVFLLEQPEDGIHNALLHKLVQLLTRTRESAQFLVSTHSSYVLDSVNPGAVRLVDIEEGRTTVRPLTDEEIDSAKAFMASEGPLSDYIEAVQE